MSERGHFRGGARGGGGGGHGGSRGRGGGGRGARGDSQQTNQSHEKAKKENILDLAKYVDKQINVKFNGGRESTFVSCPPLKEDEDQSLTSWT
jgi:U6 snRNA-associated Sm-like protein LSm7